MAEAILFIAKAPFVKINAAFLSLLALTACGNREPIRVNVPVPVACVRPSQVPPETSPLGPIPQSAVQAADLLAAKLLEVRGEARTLRSLITACIGED